MTNITANYSFNMSDHIGFFWRATSYSASQVTIAAGVYSIQYLGDLTYDVNSSNLFGRLTGYAFKISGIAQYEISDIDTDAYQASVDLQWGFSWQLYERILTGADLITGSNQGDILFAFAGKDLLNALGGNDFADGGLGRDRMNGEQGNDTLLGGDGSDRLAGGLGNDSLTGGTGDDKFVFDTTLTDFNRDRIVDFKLGHDIILLENSGVGLFNALALGDFGATRFKDTAVAAVDENDRILYNHITGILSYDRDGSGIRPSVEFAIIETHLTLTAVDFLVI